MKINIYKDENGKMFFKLNNDKPFEFVYDNFEKLIDNVYQNNDEIKYMFDKEYEEYKQLLEGIIIESRKQDFRDAVTAVNSAIDELEKEEEKLEVDEWIKYILI